MGVRLDSSTLAFSVMLAFGLVARVILVFTMPPWQSPDEPKHFEYIRVLTDLRSTLWAERRLPTLDDALPDLQGEIIVSLARSHYWEGIVQPTPNPLPTRFVNVWPDTYTQLHRPSLYYFLAAPILLPFTTTSLDTQVRVVRLFSVLLSTLTIWAVYLTARLVVRDDPFVSLASAAFAAALPMNAYIGASINNDNLETLLGTVVCLGLIWGLCRGFRLKTWLLVLGAFGLGLATKRGIVGLAPAIGLAWVFWLPSLRGWRLGIGLAVLGAAAFVGLMLLDALGPQIGPGWLLPTRLRDRVIGYALNDPGQLVRLLHLAPASPDSPGIFQVLLHHQTLMFWGFWGVFGWYTVVLTPQTYKVLALVTGLCALGFAIWLGQQFLALRGARAALARRNVLVGLLCLAAIMTMVVLAEGERLAYFVLGGVPQGRYLFVVIGPIALTLALGARTFLPARPLGTWLPLLAIVLGLLILDMGVYVNQLLPFFQSGALG